MTRPLTNKPRCVTCHRAMHQNSITLGKSSCRVCRDHQRYVRERDTWREIFEDAFKHLERT